ncbi:carbamoyl-phosphate synthase (glutamine-hydrolyzing) large subunit [Caloramator proteoclasticus]|uniref:Carbamoyl phosphate synthase large chain n=1 Tax=Caloramator proteoclasticus DSM 10124 TaxID=1121262 RepID=A0A1M4T0D9_9CLOT|nr:carbamoyl-phosphate synthase (glutamine-hydrolyzing) large subunit [Caloramator proteoclasticus]SHE37909.1 carbamoyl-phosphate synthase large subunit [Caloramator proteoclasticus DSM 10124]
MPLNRDIKKVLVIGSGPIIIGQAAEFDYSGTQACMAIKEEGIEVVLVNSNPATIMTDKEVADKVYIEPLTAEVLERIIEKERPDSLLAGMGGQTGLNLAVELYEKGILQKYNVNVIGTKIEAIKRGEDRELFRELMKKINQPIIDSEIVTTLEDGLKFAKKIGYPVIVRPAYTLGGTGGGIAENEEELEKILDTGLKLSSIGQVLIEKSVKGWKEIEYEVIRDSQGNCITVCNMENIDPVGVHTGDSIVVAPSQTLSDREYQMLRTAAIDIINAVGIEGGCNVQFALNPDSFQYAVIEINPRVSRSSALASKATGYPIAKVATKIALGYSLDEIKNEITNKTYACFEPSLDYVVVKIPKWPFDKFAQADNTLGTKMMATGEVMAIGRNFEEALLKGVRSLEIGAYSLEFKKYRNIDIDELKQSIKEPTDEGLFIIAELLRRGIGATEISNITKIDKFFIYKIKNIVDKEEKLKKLSLRDINREVLIEYKKIGFSDRAIAEFLNVDVEKIKNLRREWNINPAYKMVDTCAGEFEAETPYYYSTYEDFDEVIVTNNKKVVVIGSGPIRIGQGIEFDYSSVHCVLALKRLGFETIIINNNPETVSTDFNISDKLYFEPLTEEDVLNVIEKEKPYGVILQFGGQTAIKLAKYLDKRGITILGTSSEQIDLAEDRERFDELLEGLNIKRPKGRAVWSVEEGIKASKEIGFPLLVRPSYVLGGQGMEITRSEDELKFYLMSAFERDNKNPVLIDKYICGREIEVDAISDGEDVLIPGIMEHLESAGVHSGDSITIYPTQGVSQKIKEKVLEYTKKISKAIGIKGMLNIQFIEHQDELYVIEVNPRASRTVPFISKVTKVPIVEVATRVMLGEKLKDIGYGVNIYKEAEIVAVKVPVFSTEKLKNAEIALGPQMKSTGEVLGVGRSLNEALYKGFLGVGLDIRKIKNIFASVNDYDKYEFINLAKRLKKLGCEIYATDGTYRALNSGGIEVRLVKDDDILNFIDRENINLVINTPTKGNDLERYGFKIRRRAIERNIRVLTSLDTLRAVIEVMENRGDYDVYNL